MYHGNGSKGFSLVELVTIIVILGVLAFFALPRLRIQDSSLLGSRDIVLAALSHAQQVAMARDSASNPITFVASSNAVDVQDNGVSINLPGLSYPIDLPNDIIITGGIGTLNYNKLGQTTPTTISINSGAVVIAVEASGYAH